MGRYSYKQRMPTASKRIPPLVIDRTEQRRALLRIEGLKRRLSVSAQLRIELANALTRENFLEEKLKRSIQVKQSDND